MYMYHFRAKYIRHVFMIFYHVPQCHHVIMLRVPFNRPWKKFTLKLIFAT